MATALLFTGLLIPVALLAVMIVRIKQSFAKDRAQQAAFASRLGLRGSVGSLSLAGEYDGLPLYVTQEGVHGDRGIRVFTRVRLLTSGAAGQRDPGGYRDQHGPAGVTFAVRRDEGFSFELAAGLCEVPTGDGVLDAVYRCFVAPGEPSPWSDPAVRASLRQMPDTLVRVERGAAECAATFIGSEANAAALERIVAVLSTLASPQGAKRHRAELEAPLDASPPVEDVRVRWAVTRFLVVTVVGAVAIAPLAFMDWPGVIVATVACPPGDGITHGKRSYCVNSKGIPGENVGGTWGLVMFDIGWASVLAVFSVVEAASRLGRRRPA